MARYLKSVSDIIDNNKKYFGVPVSYKTLDFIPETTDIPIENPSRWLKINDVICVFVDMVNSTKLSAVKHSGTTAQAYNFFTGTAVDMFHHFKAPYIDIKGDGVFALFNKSQPYSAFCAAVSFKTFCQKEFSPKLNAKLKDKDFKVGSHIGIDQKTLLVRKIGLKRHGGRTDRQNEVWAGRAVNMAAKLASLSNNGEILISERFYTSITCDEARYSCGCDGTGKSVGKKQLLWSPQDVSQSGKFDFKTAYRLGSDWCGVHGEDFCKNMLALEG